MTLERGSAKVALLSAAALLLLLVLSHSLWMGWMGAYLVESEQPVRADVVVVLAGDPYGHRILKAAELVKQGYAPQVLVSGAPGFYDMHESDLAIPFAVRHGYPREWFIAMPHQGHSTQEEARIIMDELHRRNAHRVILVTSDYHSRRAAHLFRSHAEGLDVRMVTAPDDYFSAHGWWHTREGRKTFFLEWTKTLTSMVGM